MPASQLPERPSLEQLRKRAKDLLKAFRAGDDAAVRRVHVILSRAVERPASDVTLADVLFIIAREHEFESWANLVHHIEALGQSGLAQFERLARELADAYRPATRWQFREINWNYGTSFVRDHQPATMQQRLATWFASQDRTMDLALADTRRMVAHSYGFETWASFAETFARPRRPKTAAAHGVSSAPPFYAIFGR